MKKPFPKIAGYEFSDGARFQKGAVQDPTAVGAHLEMLRKRAKGELTPDEVVDDARHNNSPLHSFFEWDDSAAAQQHRLAQARGLIRSVVAIYTTPDAPARRMKAFVHIAEKGAPHYRDTAQAMSETKTREMVLRRAHQELIDWKARYKDLAEFAKVFEATEEVTAQLFHKAS